MLKFAIIGCGKSSAAHIVQINRIGKLVAVCDILPQKADELANRFGAKAYYNASELLEQEHELDIICVCTPNGCHAEHCIKSLQSGFHVICEGPLCLTTAAAWQMIETEKFCRKRLVVVNTVLLNPDAKALKLEIEKNTSGQVFNFDLHCMAEVQPDNDWRNKIFPGGGALYTHFSRYIHMLVYLFGEIEDVKGYCANRHNLGKLETEDTGEAVLDMKNGILGEIHWKLDSSGNTKDSLVVSKIKKPIIINDDQLASIIIGDEDAYSRIYEDMIRAIREKAQSQTGLYQNIRTVEAIEKIYKAVSSNHS
jgi:UDP-N-acetyl-2-amino-2-deoxyglucuronate dehydrogenase